MSSLIKTATPVVFKIFVDTNNHPCPICGSTEACSVGKGYMREIAMKCIEKLRVFVKRDAPLIPQGIQTPGPEETHKIWVISFLAQPVVYTFLINHVNASNSMSNATL